MQLNGNDNFDANEYLREALTAEVLDYINRVANINVADASKFESFFKALETELVKVATNRKFLVLNTNVIRETHQRVLANESVRMFYMELVTSLRVRIHLELGNGAFETIVKLIVDGYNSPVLKEHSDQQALVIQNSDEKQLAGQLPIQSLVVTYLQNNAWYFGIILCNYFAASLLDQIRTLERKMKDPAPNKPNK